MKAFIVTYELSDPDTKQFVCQIDSQSILVEDRPDVLPALKRMYPMYDIDLTTINWDTDVNSALKQLSKDMKSFTTQYKIMKRTIESIKDNEVVWCKSPLEAEEFCKLLDVAGRTDHMERSFNTYTDDYPGELCYDINHGQFCDRSFYKERSKIITPATEFIEDKQTPAEDKQEGHGGPMMQLSEQERVAFDAMKSTDNSFLHMKPLSWTQMKSVPYQLCPMCHGKKLMYDEPRPKDSVTVVTKCDICKGEGVIPQHIIE